MSCPIVQPSVWLLTLITGLVFLPESVYTASLPDIAHFFHTSESMVEYTLTTYIGGLAIGTVLWGPFSDRWGRKPAALGGTLFFIIGCLGCYKASTITQLLIFRLIQGLGASVGSIVSQAITRDTFKGRELGRVYATVGSALAVFPALGPSLGSLIAQGWGWKHIFSFLSIFGLGIVLLIICRLPETLPSLHRHPVALKATALDLIKDKFILGMGGIVAIGSGLGFSFYAEAPFCLIEHLHLSPSLYGAIFFVLAIGSFMGGLITRVWHHVYSSQTIMGRGLVIMVINNIIFTLCIAGLDSKPMLIGVTVLCQTVNEFGKSIVISTALAIALIRYKQHIGTATSLFGFFYFILASVFTWGMGLLHNGSLLPMPLYFLGLSLSMVGLYVWVYAGRE